jgi:PTS system ascorbate-specific IIB component
MSVPRIQTVCGYGCGSSLLLRTNIQKIAKAHDIEIEAFCGDVNTCCANDCDVIFISRELGEHIKDRAKVPVIEVDNFMNKAEVEQKTLAYLESYDKQ